MPLPREVLSNADKLNPGSPLLGPPKESPNACSSRRAARVIRLAFRQDDVVIRGPTVAGLSVKSEGSHRRRTDSARAQDGHSCHRIGKRLRRFRLRAILDTQVRPISSPVPEHVPLRITWPWADFARDYAFGEEARSHNPAPFSTPHNFSLPGIRPAPMGAWQRQFTSHSDSVNCSATVARAMPTIPPSFVNVRPDAAGRFRKWTAVCLTHGASCPCETPKVRAWPFCNAPLGGYACHPFPSLLGSVWV